MTTQSINTIKDTNSAPIGWAESGLIPDVIIRAGIRKFSRQRITEINAQDCETSSDVMNAFVAMMNGSAIALVPELANEQHYEVPPEFFSKVLGHHHKYSSCYWPEGVTCLDDAEEAALAVSCDRAGIVDGMDVLDLGCGWGSLSLWIAQHYPACKVVSVSNSAPQRAHIQAQVQRRGLSNIRVITNDMNVFGVDQQFDRIVSIEMFEHMRNYREMFSRVNRWLKPDGRFFMHIFCHRNSPYEFIDQGPADWMSRHFFSGGIMPSADLPLRFQQDLQLQSQWKWDGRHYEKTANAWLSNMDQNLEEVKTIFRRVYGPENTQKWVMRWRMFFMACAELFAFDKGQEWFVSHYLFAPGDSGDRTSAR